MVLKNMDSGEQIGAETIPGLKRPKLYYERDGKRINYATFSSEFAAIEFMDKLAHFIGVEREEHE